MFILETSHCVQGLYDIVHVFSCHVLTKGTLVLFLCRFALCNRHTNTFCLYEIFGVFFTGGEGEGDRDGAALNESLLKWFEY